jgi:hypothetical protein
MSPHSAPPRGSLGRADRSGTRPCAAPAAATCVALLGLVSVALVAPLAAQEAAPAPGRSWTRPVARWGKWLTAAAAVGFTALAVREHAQSADSWDALLSICRTDNADCAIGPNGRYLNIIAENHYQRSLYFDARARRRLVVGQATLVVAAALFIVDLSRGRNGPPNVPFDPNRLEVGPGAGGGTRIGVRLQF